MSEEAVQEFQIAELTTKKTPWRLLIHPDRLRFEKVDDATVRVVPRAGWRTRMDVQRLFGSGTLKLKFDQKVTFKLDKATLEAIQTWTGPPTTQEMVRALRTRAIWLVVIGILMIGDSAFLLLSGSVDFASRPPLATMSLGVVAAVLALPMLLLPRRVFFLLDGLWWGALACVTLFVMVTTGSSPWLIVLVVTQILVVIGGIGQYRRFAVARDAESVPPAAAAAAEPELLEPIVEESPPDTK